MSGAGRGRMEKPKRWVRGSGKWILLLTSATSLSALGCGGSQASDNVDCPSSLVTQDGHVHFHCHDSFRHARVVTLEGVPGAADAVMLPSGGHTAVFRGTKHGSRLQILDLSQGLTDDESNPTFDGVSVRDALVLSDDQVLQRVRLQSSSDSEPNVHFKVDSPFADIDVTLFEGTTLFASEWDGLFSVAEDVTAAVNREGSIEVHEALRVGNANGPLVVDKPVRVVIDAEAGSPHIASDYLGGEAQWFELEPCSDDATADAPGRRLEFPDACWLRDDASGLTTVWTHHLSTVAARADNSCKGTLPAQRGETVNLSVDTCVSVPSGTSPYVFKHVNIISGGELRFIDDGGVIDFRASSILIEQGGTLRAGSAASGSAFGAQGGQLNIGLWGDDPTHEGAQVPPAGQEGIACSGAGGTCYPATVKGKACTKKAWIADPTSPCTTDAPQTGANAGSLNNSLFEDPKVAGPGQYDNLPYDSAPFGFKVLAVSYGGSLELHGFKGAGAAGTGVTLDKNRQQCDTPANDPLPPPGDPAAHHNDVQAWANYSGNSWARVATQPTASELTVDRAVTWEPGDRIVVATNDWFVGNSEVATIASNTPASKTLTLVTDGKEPAGPRVGDAIPYGEGEKLAHSHDGNIFKAKTVAEGSKNTEIEARAAVGLLSRSIKIYSLGKTSTDAFPTADACAMSGATLPATDCYFGGHIIARQGFSNFHVSGVEFYQLGQGGRMGHYPVHFHKVKGTGYTNAYLIDSSIWDSMTRFVTVHATHDVEITRNVGHLSIGHGFYLEDGSEINNLLCHNLGVTTRPSIQEFFNAQESLTNRSGSGAVRTARAVPPILNTMADGTLQGSDSVYPTMYWMMNAYNDFVGNAAVGVGGFGVCYWPLSSSISGPSRTMTWAREKDSGVPKYQTNSPHDYANFNIEGQRQAPLKSFVGNSCQTAAYAFMTERNSLVPNNASPGISAVVNPYSTLTTGPNVGMLNPGTAGGLPQVNSNFNAMRFAAPGVDNPSCLTQVLRTEAANLALNATYCVTTVLDRFSTRFNWPQVNFGSVWLRAWNYVVVNSAIADQLSGGLGFVSGGSWEQVLPGYLTIVKDGLLYGTLSDGADAHKGPDLTGAVCNANNCFLWDNGTGVYVTGYAPKRLITIYDGPFFAEGNTFGKVFRWSCNPFVPSADCGVYQKTNQPMLPDVALPPLTGNEWPYVTTEMWVVDAAIGWKQPNGFYYPPAFAFRKTHFEKDNPAAPPLPPKFFPDNGAHAPTERHNVFDPGYAYYQGSPTGNPGRLVLLGSSTTLTPPAPPQTPVYGTDPTVTPIDFTTILNDLDGTLNGVVPSTGTSKRTTGLSNNYFYSTPGQDVECNSFGTNTIPHDFVSSVMTELTGSRTSDTTTNYQWVNNGANMPMVPIYRQYYLTDPADDQCTSVTKVCDGTNWGCRRGSFMIGAQNGQAPLLTTDRGVYYIDTKQNTSGCVFDGEANPLWEIPGFENQLDYAVYNLFSNKQTEVTYQVFVGEVYVGGTDIRMFDVNDVVSFVRVDPHTFTGDGRSMSVTPWVPTPGPDAPSVKWANDEQTVIQVTMRTTAIASDYDFVKSATSCQPTDICQVDKKTNKSCEVSDAYASTPISGAINDVCANWVTARDSQLDDGVFLADCPRGGCPGFAFTMGDLSSFELLDESYATYGAPLAMPFPTSEPWDRKLSSVSAECSGND